MCKVMLATGMIVGYAYAVEFFTAWYSGNPYERFVFLNRAIGPYAWAVWIMFTCNVLVPQVFWFKRFRNSIPVMFVVSILINVGMWFERFVIIVTSLHRDYLPSSWGYFRPTLVDILTFRRQHRPVPDAVPAVRAVPADDRHDRSERRRWPDGTRTGR